MDPYLDCVPVDLIGDADWALLVPLEDGGVLSGVDVLLGGDWVSCLYWY